MEFWYALVVGLIIGALFGFILQRGRFCMNSAFRDIILLKEFKLAKAVVVSLAVLMVGYAIFAFGGVIDLAPKPFKPWGAIVGGLVFGIGMVLASGCASGTTYRVGEGMMGSFVAAIGLTFGAVTTTWGVLSGAKTYLQEVVVGEGPPLTLFGEFDVDLTPIFMIIVGLVGIALMFIFWGLPAIKKKRQANEPLIKTENFVESTFKKGYPWWVTGILIGIILTAGYVASNGVVGITGGWREINQWFVTEISVMWAGSIIFGIIFGAFISAYIGGEFKFRVPKDGLTILKQFIGIPQLSLHSIVTGAFIVFGSWLAAYLLFMWRQE